MVVTRCPPNKNLTMSSNLNPTDTKVFVYTGEGGADVPEDVVRVRVDPSVTSIPAKAFLERRELAEVELCEGLVEIGEESFNFCCHSISVSQIGKFVSCESAN